MGRAPSPYATSIKYEEKTLKVVGSNPTDRSDAVEKVTGRARYGDDLIVPRMLHAKILRSPHAHANIISIDVSKAKALKGVKAGRDLQRRRVERLRDTAFYYDLATDMNFNVYERFEPMGLRLAALGYRLQLTESATDSAHVKRETAKEPDGDLMSETLLAVGEVQGTAAAVESINRDYFAGENMLFPAEQPKLYALEEQAVFVREFACEVLGSEPEQARLQSQGIEQEIADLLVSRWTTHAAQRAAREFPLPLSKPPAA